MLSATQADKLARQRELGLEDEEEDEDGKQQQQQQRRPKVPTIFYATRTHSQISQVRRRGQANWPRHSFPASLGRKRAVCPRPLRRCAWTPAPVWAPQQDHWLAAGRVSDVPRRAGRRAAVQMLQSCQGARGEDGTPCPPCPLLCPCPQVVRELKNSGYAPTMAILASRKHYCINSAALSSGSVDETCEQLARDSKYGGCK